MPANELGAYGLDDRPTIAMLRHVVRMRSRSYAVPASWVRSPTAMVVSLSLERRAERLAEHAVAARLFLVKQHRLCDGRGLLRLVERLAQVPQDIVDVFDADRDPDHLRPDAAGEELGIGELLVRGRRRMDDQ